MQVERGHERIIFIVGSGMNLNSSYFNLDLMSQTRKRGRPREWVLDEEIIRVHSLLNELKIKNPQAHWSTIKNILKKHLEQSGENNLLQKINKIYGLIEQVIPIPPRCICGCRRYSYTHRKVENEKEHYWEIFARCVNPNCRYMRRYLPSAVSYKWSRPKSVIKELAKTPTFYELDGQLVEQK
jgi:hypothetical protein